MKLLFNLILLCVVIPFSQSQTVVQAEQIIADLSAGKNINISQAIIEGDLNFTGLANQSKGGRYGTRGGIVQEYYARITTEIRFSDCQFTGALITKSETRLGREIQEKFTTLCENMKFSNCTFDKPVKFESMKIQKVLSFDNCSFNDVCRLEHVSFDMPPQFTSNSFYSKFINKNTNWSANENIKKNSNSMSKETITVSLNNQSARKIKIIFGSKTWNLSPFGHSKLSGRPGLKIYKSEKGSRRIILTLNENLNGQTINVANL